MTKSFASDLINRINLVLFTVSNRETGHYRIQLIRYFSIESQFIGGLHSTQP